MFHGFARCQYKQFSTHEFWLPKTPSGPHDANNIANVSVTQGVNVSCFDFVGGKDFFLEKLGVVYDMAKMKKLDLFSVDSDVIAKLSALQSIYHHLQQVEAKSLLRMKVQFDNADISDPPPESMVTATMHELERKYSTEDEAVIVLMKSDACRMVSPRFLNVLDEHTFLDGMPDLKSELGVDVYAAAIMQQLAPVFKSSAKATIAAIIRSEPPSTGVDVLQFMRRTLLYIEQHKELIKRQKRVAKEVRTAPDGIDPRNVEDDNDQEELGDLSIGVEGADIIAKTARDVFRVLFNGHIYTWSRGSGK